MEAVRRVRDAQKSLEEAKTAMSLLEVEWARLDRPTELEGAHVYFGMLLSAQAILGHIFAGFVMPKEVVYALRTTEPMLSDFCKVVKAK